MADPQIPQIDILHYAKQRNLGNAGIVKIDGAPHLRMTPEKPAPLLVPISAEVISAGIKQKEAQKAAIDGEIETLREVLSDIEAAKELGA